MKTWHLWVGLALGLLLLLSVREGFVATATIKSPNSWDAAELTRIRALVTPPSTLTDAEIREVVGGFWSYSVPSALPNEPATPKGWSVATTQITTADVAEYMDGIVRTTPAYAEKRAAFTALLTAYYIAQGQSTFQEARGNAPTSPGPEPSEPSTTPPPEIERPTSATQSLRQEIATTFAIPLTDSTSIDAVVAQVQRFYDTVYLPDKTEPSYTQLMGFADGVNTETLPAGLKNNFKVRIVEVLQTYFTKPGGVSGMSATGDRMGGADLTTSAATGGAEEGSWAGTGKTIQGPSSGGRGIADVGTTTGGIGIPRNYPVLYGGTQEYKSAIPGSASLGSDPAARFLPYSRIPGDQDLYPDPYRLGKYFSSSTYSSGKDAPEPAPFLADFSKFFT
jgi:hypothetical protein